MTVTADGNTMCPLSVCLLICKNSDSGSHFMARDKPRITAKSVRAVAQMSCSYRCSLLCLVTPPMFRHAPLCEQPHWVQHEWHCPVCGNKRYALARFEVHCSRALTRLCRICLGLHTLKDWCERGYSAIEHYDKEYSDWFAIPRSIKTTCVKPSGTVSLLAGGELKFHCFAISLPLLDCGCVFTSFPATPGMHYPESRFYIRRVRIPSSSELLQPLQKAGYSVEPSVMEDNTHVVSIPVDVGEGVRT